MLLWGLVSSTTYSESASGKLSDARDKVEDDEGDGPLSRFRIIILRLARDRKLTTGSSKGNSLDFVDENRCFSGMETVRTRLNDDEDDVSDDVVMVVLLLRVDAI